MRELLHQAETEVEEGSTLTQQQDKEVDGLRVLPTKKKQKEKRL